MEKNNEQSHVAWKGGTGFKGTGGTMDDGLSAPAVSLLLCLFCIIMTLSLLNIHLITEQQNILLGTG